MRYGRFVVFSLVIAVGLGVFIISSGGYYPVAVVNGRLVLNSTFRKDMSAASAYFDSLIRAYNTEEEATPLSLTRLDVEAEVLTRIVEDILIREKAEDEFGGELATLIGAKMNEISRDGTFRDAAAALYGLPFADVREIILVPQARRDILRNSLFLKGVTLEEWLSLRKKEVSVRIFSKNLSWDGDEVKVVK